MNSADGVNSVDGENGENGENSADGANSAYGMNDADGTDGANREAIQNMTHRDGTPGDITHSTALERDIALLLADAAGEVEIGIAPYQAVVRGGRRRKARRWAVAAAAAVVIAGSTGTLALAGVADGNGGRVAPAATAPVTSEARHLGEPWRIALAEGRDQGTVWQVSIDVWEAPRNRAEAADQLAEMGLFGDVPTGLDGAADLVGKTWNFVHLTLGSDQMGAVIDGEADALSGTDLEVYSTVLRTGGDRDKDGAPERLVIGTVAPTAQQVRVTWSDGTTTNVNHVTDLPYYADLRNPRIVEVKGAQTNWFVALAPEGVGYESAKVTK